MSKERELLERVITTHSDYGINTLYREIDKILAQPEHIEDKLVMVEPAAWMYERQNGDFTERTLSVGFEKNFDGTTIPLYTSPPKREPLSYEKIVDVIQSNILNGLHDLARAIEKAHGIGDRDE